MFKRIISQCLEKRDGKVRIPSLRNGTVFRTAEYQIPAGDRFCKIYRFFRIFR